MHRRNIIAGGSILLATGAFFGFGIFRNNQAAAKPAFPYQKSDAAWRRDLSRAQYDVLRQEETERAFSSPLNNEKRKGTYVCAGCSQQIYRSNDKYDSGTGWPSFIRPISGKVATKTDYSIGLPRTEVHCARCGGHLGHVFDDGPKPTGKRYCMNGAAMKFIAA
ncbi:peptide-methionine (R)-S-oxide reductase [Sphingorhabdus lutea]|uniref:peptide-methionine (R)-S-oxide reductase n=1 Tax=Sphingorhabdus lutea TaxID=1913578 RepID=A0A1L3JEA9_9SPHN|nr:peptide-methionine (R)-S-oxide reductase [Sphingorhabdus lutea]